MKNFKAIVISLQAHCHNSCVKSCPGASSAGPNEISKKINKLEFITKGASTSAWVQDTRAWLRFHQVDAEGASAISCSTTVFWTGW